MVNHTKNINKTYKMAKTKKKEEITVEGLGDKIAKLTSFLGIKPCDSCKKRQDWLNKTFPSLTAIEMSDDEVMAFAEVKDKRVLTNSDLTFIQTLYYKTFQIKNKINICRTCPPVWKDIIAKLTKVYEIQITTDNGEEV